MVKRQTSAKLLGMTLEENCSWKTHISGTHENIKNSKTNNESAMISRSKIEGELLIKHGSDNLKSTYKNDGIKAWNSAPDSVKNCKSLFTAKKLIRAFALSLPF